MIYPRLKTIFVAMGVLTVAAQINVSEVEANIVTLNQDIQQRPQINLNNNPKLDEPQLNKEVYLNEQFTLIPGQSVKLYTKKYPGLVEGVQLTIKNFRTYSNSTRVEDISVNKFQEFPQKNQQYCSSILISKSGDYTITPITNQSKRSHRRFIGCSLGMILELINVTDSGEATVILKYYRY